MTVTKISFETEPEIKQALDALNLPYGSQKTVGNRLFRAFLDCMDDDPGCLGFILMGRFNIEVKRPESSVPNVTTASPTGDSS